MPRSKRTKTFAAASLVLLVVVGTAVAYKGRETRQADAALRLAGTSIQNEVQRFHRSHAEYPREVHLHRDVVELVGTSSTETNTVQVRPDIRLDWYTNTPDPRISTPAQSQSIGYAYCLSTTGRHWRLNATKDAISAQPNVGGACPAAPCS